MCWQAIRVTFKNQSFQTGIRAEGGNLARLAPTDAGEDAHLQLQAAQFFFLSPNCLPKPSSIFHRPAAEKNASLQLNRM